MGENVEENGQTLKSKDKNSNSELKKENNEFITLFNLLKKEGLRALYSGLGSAITISITQNGVYFVMKRLAKTFLKSNDFSLSPIVQFLFQNLIAALFTAIITNPLYVINTRMASLDSNFQIKNFQMIEMIYKNEGFKGFFKGLIPSLILIINPIIQFTIYDGLERIYKSKHPQTGLKNNEIVLMSFISKLVTTIVTYPITTFKTIKMSNSTNSTDAGNSFTFFDVISNYGLLSLYKGFFSKIIGSEISSIIMMLTFENTKKLVKYYLLKYLFK